MSVLHYNPADGRNDPRRVWDVGNPADFVDTACGHRAQRFDTTSDPDAVTCKECCGVMALQAEQALTGDGR